MKVILDECLPKRLARELTGHEAVTVPMAGWAGIQNGDLLRRIAGNYDAFITIDGNLVHQQNTASLSFSVIILRAPSNKFEDIHPLIPDILQALATAKPGQILYVPE
ncbi:MAG TPA: DUF5615 family PIN-like protein [Chthoniobacteraceae bacterium]|nr:DUF5615 family PIN-like protein [Chthoniobacteraceae bacterium]